MLALVVVTLCLGDPEFEAMVSCIAASNRRDTVVSMQYGLRPTQSVVLVSVSIRRPVLEMAEPYNLVING